MIKQVEVGCAYAGCLKSRLVIFVCEYMVQGVSTRTPTAVITRLIASFYVSIIGFHEATESALNFQWSGRRRGLLPLPLTLQYCS